MGVESEPDILRKRHYRYVNIKMAASDNDHLLQILNAHGQQFLSSFSLPTSVSDKKRKRADSPSRAAKLVKLSSPESDEEEEWAGIQVEGSESDEDPENGEYMWTHIHSVMEFCLFPDFEQEDDDFTSAPPNETVVVFSETTSKSGPSSLSSLAQKKAFMVCGFWVVVLPSYKCIQSSKVSKLREDPGVQQPDSAEVDDEDER